jgi:signal peptidase II
MNVTRRSGLIIAALVFLADQLIKYIVTVPMDLPNQGEIILAPIFRFLWVNNPGVAMGILVADSPIKVLALTLFTGAISAFVAHWLWKESNRTDVIGLGLILGGALGNLTDRIRFGHVIDFMNLHFGEFSPFLVFNIADTAITVGVLILLARALLSRDKKPDAENDDA